MFSKNEFTKHILTFLHFKLHYEIQSFEIETMENKIFFFKKNIFYWTHLFFLKQILNHKWS